jgi:hypothetical protein
MAISNSEEGNVINSIFSTYEGNLLVISSHQTRKPSVIIKAATFVIAHRKRLPTTSTNADKKELK